MMVKLEIDVVEPWEALRRGFSKSPTTLTLALAAMLFAELLTWSLLPTSSGFYNSVKFEGSDCGFANVSTRKVAGHIWEYQEFYDCYDSDTVNILALPDSHLDLEKCAKNCLDDTYCTGFNFPRGHLGPDNERFCFLKFRGEQIHGRWRAVQKWTADEIL